MTDFRALCEQLMELVEGKRYDGSALIAKARAELAKPAPERLTAKELRPIFDDQSGYIGDEQVMWFGDFVAAARAVLTRWGNV